MLTYSECDPKFRTRTREEIWRSWLCVQLKRISKTPDCYVPVMVEIDFDKKLMYEWVKDNNLVLYKDTVLEATKIWVLWLRAPNCLDEVDEDE